MGVCLWGKCPSHGAFVQYEQMSWSICLGANLLGANVAQSFRISHFPVSVSPVSPDWQWRFTRFTSDQLSLWTRTILKSLLRGCPEDSTWKRRHHVLGLVLWITLDLQSVLVLLGFFFEFHRMRSRTWWRPSRRRASGEQRQPTMTSFTFLSW